MLNKGRSARCISLGRLACGFLCLFFVINFLAFGYYLAFDYPLGDYWRWMRELLVPYANNEIGLFSYLTGEFALLSHSHILTLGALLFKYNFLNLQFDYDVYFGLACYLLSAGFFMFHLKQLYAEHINTLSVSFLFCLLLSVYFSLATANVFTWTLLSFEYLYWLMAIILLIACDRLFTLRQSGLFYFLWFIPLFFLGDAIGLAALFATIALPFFLCFQKQARKVLLFQILLFAVCIVAAKWLIPSSAAHSRASKPEALIFILSNFRDAIHFLLNCFSQSVISVSILKWFFGKGFVAYQLAIGIFVLILNAAAVFLFYRQQIYKRTVLPLLFILFTGISIFGIMLTRLPTFGPDYAFGARYIRLFLPSLIGCLWVFWETCILNLNNKRAFLKKSVFYGMAVAVIAIQLATVAGRWKYVDFKKNYQQDLLETTYSYYYNPGEEVRKRFGQLNPRCRKDYCDSVMAFLEENRLSFFASAPPPKKNLH